MIRNAAIALSLALTLTNGSSAQNTYAQVDTTRTVASENMYAPVPFGVGEEMKYEVRLGVVGDVGTGSLTVVRIDTVHGHPTYQLRFRIEGGIPFAHVKDDYQSWLDTKGLFSRRFKQDQKEVRYERKRTFEFFPAERLWRRTDKVESGPLPTDAPLDDVSFLYFVRTLPLEVGKTFTMNRYFQASGNPVTIKVLRKQKITTKAGTFNTIVVQPIIQTKGLFSEGGKAEVYFTDDDQRILVAIKSRVKVLKTLDLLLEGYTPGKRMAATAR